jgi:hypothetical protein
MSTIYFINPGSSFEDGLTPATGYKNFSNLLSNVVLNPYDTINLVSNGVIDDSASSSIVISVSISILSWFSNESKPTWRAPTNFSIVGASSFSISDIVFNGTSILAINGMGSIPSDPTCTDISIQRCDFSENTTVSIYGLTNGNICNNLFRDTNNPSLKIDNFSGDVIPDVLSLYINNNTFYNIGGYCIGFLAMGNASNIRILNNIFSSSFDKFFWILSGSGSNILIDYNLSFSTPIGFYTPDDSFVGIHEIPNSDPQFVNPTNGDFSLPSTSPCINTGVGIGKEPSVPVNDFKDIVRPQTLQTDIGAYEHSLTPNPPVTTTPAPLVSFVSGYRLQDDDLNMTFFAQGIAYPPYLTYSYTPYSVKYEIDYIDPINGLRTMGTRNRIPQLVKPGTYRANLIIEDSWTPGLYQIVWKYKVSENSDIQESIEMFGVNDLGVHYVPFQIFFCQLDIPATFLVLQDLQDLPASFTIVP